MLSLLGCGPSPPSANSATTHDLAECSGPSIDRLQHWLASGEGPTVPQKGSLLNEEDNSYVARATFTSNDEWHVLVIWLGNEFGASVDLKVSPGFTLSYSATSDFYIQLRPAFEWNGGHKWHLSVPSTGGQRVTSFFPFQASTWKKVDALGTPPHTLAEAQADASGLVVVGNTQNTLAFFSLRIDGFSPPCL